MLWKPIALLAGLYGLYLVTRIINCSTIGDYSLSAWLSCGILS